MKMQKKILFNFAIFILRVKQKLIISILSSFRWKTTDVPELQLWMVKFEKLLRSDLGNTMWQH